MRRFITTLLAFFLLNTSAISGELHSRVLDTAYFSYVSPAIAIGPHREVAILSANYDTVFLYLSTDNGRTFTKSSFDHHWELGYDFESEMGPADVAFDHNGTLYLFWSTEHGSDAIDWQYRRVAWSTDGGKTFKTQTMQLDISNIYNEHFSFDEDNNVLLVGAYYYAGWSEKNFAAAYSVIDSTVRHRSVLAIPDSITQWKVEADAFSFGDSMDVVINVNYPKAFFYNYRFPNSADTVLSSALMDTSGAEYPTILTHSGKSALLANIHSESSLIFRTISDTCVSDKYAFKDNLHMYYEQPTIQKRDSSIYFAYYRYQFPDSGVCVLQMKESNGEVVDSFFLPGHHSPALATDSLNGKYLLSVFQNKLYFTTKDVVLKVGDQKPEVPSSFSLRQNFPDPYNPSTTIQFSIPHESHVTLKVYNLLGQELQTLVNDARTAGTYNVDFDAAKLPSGVYFYTLQAGRFMQTKKMLVIR